MGVNYIDLLWVKSIVCVFLTIFCTCNLKNVSVTIDVSQDKLYNWGER